MTYNTSFSEHTHDTADGGLSNSSAISVTEDINITSTNSSRADLTYNKG